MGNVAGNAKFGLWAMETGIRDLSAFRECKASDC